MTKRAMTLLELLVAMAILVSLVTLSGALWGQMRSWSGDAARMTEALRPRQAQELFRAQWQARREHVRLGDREGPSMKASSTRLEFVTARPAIFPGWPLVRASYIIERQGPPGREVFSLVYEERRVTDPDVSLDDDTDSAGAETAARITLLERCQALRWEWFARFPAPQEGDAVEPPPSGWYAATDESQEAQTDTRFEGAQLVARRLYIEHEGRQHAWLIAEPSR